MQNSNRHTNNNHSEIKVYIEFDDGTIVDVEQNIDDLLLATRPLVPILNVLCAVSEIAEIEGLDKVAVTKLDCQLIHANKKSNANDKNTRISRINWKIKGNQTIDEITSDLSQKMFSIV